MATAGTGDKAARRFDRLESAPDFVACLRVVTLRVRAALLVSDTFETITSVASNVSGL